MCHTAGLESHANYFEASPLHVYAYVNGSVSGEVLSTACTAAGLHTLSRPMQGRRSSCLTSRCSTQAAESPGPMPACLPFTLPHVATADVVSLDNLGGVYVADRTLADPYKTFDPTPDNVKYLPPADDIIAQVLCSLCCCPSQSAVNNERRSWRQTHCMWDMRLRSVQKQSLRGRERQAAAAPAAAAVQNLTGLEWALYPGNWGAPLNTPSTTFVCLYDNREFLTEAWRGWVGAAMGRGGAGWGGVRCRAVCPRQRALACPLENIFMLSMCFRSPGCRRDAQGTLPREPAHQASTRGALASLSMGAQGSSSFPSAFPAPAFMPPRPHHAFLGH